MSFPSPSMAPPPPIREAVPPTEKKSGMNTQSCQQRILTKLSQKFQNLLVENNILFKNEYKKTALKILGYVEFLIDFSGHCEKTST